MSLLLDQPNDSSLHAFSEQVTLGDIRIPSSDCICPDTRLTGPKTVLTEGATMLDSTTGTMLRFGPLSTASHLRQRG